ncbi:FAD/NAD(P)-binding domain-containing protein [Melanomma pulvis-pyrius CBS 109.77]|uniref:FAD/NAD(P)-binding domain-containing protein n=1 Tax=Melanomma pulvis-pyrius CBS 109.77 TaxID=1314802 RepID=A0A6A6X7B9_9PLEO|nr:FAD/NAD(P)-binding domain-containing protein [Melanomma pulvis-pyrius CBS 109.77]
MSDAPILIVGAGIAGLTLAQGLRLRSIPFRLFERYPRSHRSQGHRFRISKDGQTALASVLSPDLQTLLRNTAAEQHRFEPRYVDARSLDFAKPTPVDPDTMPAMPVDRTWICRLTMLGIDEKIEYEKEFSSYNVVDGHVHVQFADGSTACGGLLVGADGVKSRVRKQLQPGRRLLDLERWIMWGRTPLTESLKKNVPLEVLTWCMYLDREANVQAVVEPMTWAKNVRLESNGRLPDFQDYVYWVICAAPLPDVDLLPKTVEQKRRFLEQVTQTWHPALKCLFDSAAHDLLACAPVFSSKPDIDILVAGQTGRVTLIGDAAHAMSPMGGSGGDTTMRDSADLARTIGEEGITVGSITGFEARMEERAKERIEHSFGGGKKFWRGKEWTEYNESDV